MRAIVAQAAKAAKALFFVLSWLAALLQMLRGGHQAGVQRAWAAENANASAAVLGGWSGRRPAVHVLG
jgi:hypothetical protein